MEEGLGIPTVLDRFIQQAVMQVLQKQWNPTFSPYSYGFRPRRSAHHAVAQAQQYIAQGYGWVIDLVIRIVLAGRSGSFPTDSMSSRPACRASPVGVDEKSSPNWMFSRLSLSRFMSYLPLLSFGPSATVPGSAYLLTPPFGLECLTSLADDMTHYALC